MTEEPFVSPIPLHLEAGPSGVSIDTERLGQESMGLGLILVFLVLLRLAYKVIGRL